MKSTTIIKILGALALFIILGVESSSAQLGKIHGRVLDNEGNAAVGAKVTLKRGGAPLAGIITGADGKYEIAKVDPGTYVVEVFDGKKTAYYSVNISPGESQPLLLEMAIAYESEEDGGPGWSSEGEGIDIYPADRELFSVDPINPFVITKIELNQRAATRGSIDDLAAGAGGVTQADQGDPLNMRGGREGGTVTFVDGVKIRGNSTMPLAAIDQMSVMTGGVPAEFGDVTGGVIVVTTYNPGMQGYFGPKNPAAVRKEIRKKHKELIQKGGEGLAPYREGSFSLADTELQSSL